MTSLQTLEKAIDELEQKKNELSYTTFFSRSQKELVGDVLEMVINMLLYLKAQLLEETK